jgi:hypoxanthine-DNA glycosylase
MENTFSPNNELKTSFAPIADNETRILILGSLPGDKSLELQQYYAHPRNRFWRVIAEITNVVLPNNYDEKLKMILENKIGVWDVVHTAKRIRSLDTNILDEVPNDLGSFICNHPKLKIIAFNGSKSQKLFDKYFTRKVGLKYFLLPSTSPANASFTFERLSEKWKEIFTRENR